MDTAAEIFLLLTNDAGAPASWGTQTSWALAAATVADLLVEERVVLGDQKDPRMSVQDPSPTGRPVLDQVLRRCMEKDDRKLSAVIQDKKCNPEDEVVAQLVRDGVVGVVPAKMLGLVAEKRPTLDPGPEREIRERLRLALAGGTPTASDATLLAILQGLGVTRKVLRDETAGMSGKQVKRRVEEAAKEIKVGTAIKRALDGLNAAIMTAIVVPAVVTGGSA